MWMSLVRSSLSHKPEKKGFNKNFLVAEFMCCEGQNFRENNIFKKKKKKKKFYKRVHFDYLLVLKSVLLTELS